MGGREAGSPPLKPVGGRRVRKRVNKPACVVRKRVNKPAQSHQKVGLHVHWTAYYNSCKALDGGQRSLINR